MEPWKEDLKEARDRLTAWWNHEEPGDRPCIGFYYPRPDIPTGGIPDFWYLAKHWDNFEGALAEFQAKWSTLYYGGECTPFYFPNYGPGIMAAVFGCEPKFGSGTVWFERPTSIEEIIPFLEQTELNSENQWYQRLFHITEVAAQQGGDTFHCAVSDLGGVLDILSSFLSPKQLLIAIQRQPQIVDRCREIILDKLLQVYDTLQGIIEQYQTGCNSWLNLWCPKRWYPIQCDFSAMLSPRLFRRFVLPDIITQAENMDYALYHLDGPNEIPYLDDLIQSKCLDAIQWVPGVREETQDYIKWKTIFEKIQSADINLVLQAPPEFCARIYDLCNPKGLYVESIFIAKIAADFYLPSFIGGMEGKDDE